MYNINLIHIEKMAKIIVYFTQKGGCGKSTLSIITAGYLYHTQKKKVLVIDADSQQTVQKKRNNEIEILEENLDFEPYPVLSSTLADVALLIEKNKDKYDYIIVDLPGSLSDPKILEVVYNSNFIITPCEHDALSLTHTLESAILVTRKIKSMGGSSIEKVICMFNRIPFSQLRKIESYKEGLKIIGYDHICENVVGDNPTIGNYSKSSTIFPMKNEYMLQNGNGKFNIGGYLEEIYSLINI